MEPVFNHFDQAGNAVMVDVTGKEPTCRTAAKGDVLGVARVAGILAAKRTWEIIPLCYPLLLSHLAVEFEILEEACAVRAECTVRLSGKTGVEMEALTKVMGDCIMPREGVFTRVLHGGAISVGDKLTIV